MDIYRSLNEFIPIGSSVITIGSYDGLHRGHHEIIRSVVNHAQAKNIISSIVTFDPHPKHVLDKSRVKLPLIMSMDQKLNILQSLGISKVLIIPFTSEFSRVPAKVFMDNIILPNFNPQVIVAGYDHHFGYQREGGPEFLKRYCLDHGIDLELTEPIKDGDVIISSNNIRTLIQKGYLRRANFELGSFFGFMAKVIHGAGRGKGLHFPTANLIPTDQNQLMPKPGVYFTRGTINGLHLFGMCNFGVRPTFEEKELVLEVHLFYDDLDDIYEKVVWVEFLERIRDEKKFPSPLELKKQLEIDKIKCLELQGKYTQE